MRGCVRKLPCIVTRLGRMTELHFEPLGGGVLAVRLALLQDVEGLAESGEHRISGSCLDVFPD
jgi:hypothetical protein